MRWSYCDINRFFDGEVYGRGEVFKPVHDLLSTYIDFHSEVEISILTLWAVCIYFCTMSPAYPHLAPNGPKNSGKSTVMRMLQLSSP